MRGRGGTGWWGRRAPVPEGEKRGESSAERGSAAAGRAGGHGPALGGGPAARHGPQQAPRDGFVASSASAPWGFGSGRWGRAVLHGCDPPPPRCAAPVCQLSRHATSVFCVADASRQANAFCRAAGGVRLPAEALLSTMKYA